MVSTSKSKVKTKIEINEPERKQSKLIPGEYILSIKPSHVQRE